MKILTVLASVFLITASANATGQCSDLLNYHVEKVSFFQVMAKVYR